MSGVKRRTGYRKTVTTDALDAFPEPSENECVAKIVGTRGGSLFEVP